MCAGLAALFAVVCAVVCCSFVQGVAAAQAGVSVVQPNVGRTRDWYTKHPGVIRDPHVSGCVCRQTGLSNGSTCVLTHG